MEATTDIIKDSAEASAAEVEHKVNTFVQYFQDHILDIIEFGVRVLIALLVLFVGRALIKWIRKSVRRSFERTNADTGVAQFTDSVLKFGLYLILILIVCSNLGIELSQITVLFASAGVGVSLALQGTLSNFAGGVLILLLKPFTVGDYIIEHTNKNEGTVKEIQVFYTKLTTIDSKTIVVPNGMLANNSITNVTAQDERQLDIKVSVSYQSDLKKAKRLLDEMLMKNPNILKDKDINIFVDCLGDSSIIIGVRAWAKTEHYWPTYWALLEEIKLTFDEEGIEIPYQQVHVHIDKN